MLAGTIQIKDKSSNFIERPDRKRTIPWRIHELYPLCHQGNAKGNQQIRQFHKNPVHRHFTGLPEFESTETQILRTVHEQNQGLRQQANQQALGTPKGKKALRELNLETYMAKNSHTGIRFKGDDRYQAIESCTSSENACGGKNEISYLLHALFPSENKI